MLNDLHKFVTGTATTGDADRDAALAIVREMQGPRMFPDVLDEGVARPASVYQLIDNTPEHLLSGELDGVLKPRVQIDIYTRTHNERERLGAAMKVALDGYIGQMEGTDVGVLLWDNELNSFEPDRKEYRKTLDFTVVHY